MTKTFIRQPWQPENATEFENHEGAMFLLIGANSVTSLSIEEISLGYARARGFIQDDSKLMCGPLLQEKVLN